jgi:DNA-binding XRE family transcriptional regulator
VELSWEEALQRVHDWYAVHPRRASREIGIMASMNSQDPEAIAVRETVGKRLRELRVAHGLKQEEAAKIAGLGPQQLRSYEQGKAAHSLYPVLKLARAFGVTVDELVSPTSL